MNFCETILPDHRRSGFGAQPTGRHWLAHGLCVSHPASAIGPTHRLSTPFYGLLFGCALKLRLRAFASALTLNRHSRSGHLQVEESGYGLLSDVPAFGPCLAEEKHCATIQHVFNRVAQTFSACFEPPLARVASGVSRSSRPCSRFHFAGLSNAFSLAQFSTGQLMGATT